MILSQTLRELAGKATLALGDVLEAVDRGESISPIVELMAAVTTTHDHLANAFMRHKDTILAALELQERLDAPETVEAVTRAIHEAGPFHDSQWDYTDESKAAIAAT